MLTATRSRHLPYSTDNPPLTLHVLQSDYAMEIYKNLNNTDEDPPGK